MRKAPETDMDYLKEAIGNELYRREPLAEAILHCLSKSNLVNRSEVLDALDAIINRNLTNMINEEKRNDESSETD